MFELRREIVVGLDVRRIFDFREEMLRRIFASGEKAVA